MLTANPRYVFHCLVILTNSHFASPAVTNVLAFASGIQSVYRLNYVFPGTYSKSLDFDLCLIYTTPPSLYICLSSML